jgi:protease stability complex PrcB-like protein
MTTFQHAITALVLLLLGCQGEDHAAPVRTSSGTAGTPVPITRYGSDSSAYTLNSGIGSPREEVVRDSAAWHRLWEEIHATTTPVPDLPQVDFSQDMILVAAMGSQPTGGYDILLTGATQDSAGLTVALLERRPGTECMTTQALTRPLDLAKVPRLDGEVRFVESLEETSCGS